MDTDKKTLSGSSGGIPGIPARGFLKNRYFLLFFTFLKISLFVVGGGLAMLPVIEDVFVRKTKLISEKDMLDMVAFTQTVPGIIAVNSSVFIGNRIGGFFGALAGVFGVVLPSYVIIVVIAMCFPHLSPENEMLKGAFLGVRACVTGLISVTAIRLIRKGIHNAVEALATVIFTVAAVCGISPIWIILSSMPLGLLYVFLKNSRVTGRSGDAK